MFYRAMFAALVCVTASGISSAQDFPKPGKEHAKLKQYQGTWDAEFQMMGAEKTKAKATYKSICDGMWIASDFEGEVAGTKFTGHGLDGYDLQRKKYIGIWVDSVGSAPMTVEGDYNDKGVLVMTGSSPGPDGKPEKVKNTTEWKDKDHFTFKMFMVSAEGDEQLAFTIEYTRKK
jgi:hypothetical protein